MKIAVIDDERPSRKELIHQILSVMPDSLIEDCLLYTSPSPRD